MLLIRAHQGPPPSLGGAHLHEAKYWSGGPSAGGLAGTLTAVFGSQHTMASLKSCVEGL